MRRHSDPRDASVAGDGGGSKPGPRLPLPDESREAAAGNVLGPPSAQKAEDRPPAPVEGGEAGAGNLFDRGDVGVIPGSGVEVAAALVGEVGWASETEVEALGWEAFDRDREAKGSGEGGGPTSLPAGGYQVKPRYPDSARRQGVEGTVFVKAYVTEQGRVEQVQVEQSAGHPDLTRRQSRLWGAALRACPPGAAIIAMWCRFP